MSQIIKIHDRLFEPYITGEVVRAAVTAVAERINADYRHTNTPPLLMVTLSGGLVFGGELLRQISVDCEVGFVKLSSYGSGMHTSGRIREDVAPTVSTIGRDVIIVEDVVDSGNTIEALDAMFKSAGAASVRVATLLIKREVYSKNIPIDYVAIESENKFIIGYGLDYDGLGRNLDGIYTVIEQ